MNIVEDSRIFSRGEDREKANEVIIPNEAQVSEAEPSQVDAGIDASEKNGGAGSLTSTQES